MQNLKYNTGSPYQRDYMVEINEDVIHESRRSEEQRLSGKLVSKISEKISQFAKLLM